MAEKIDLTPVLGAVDPEEAINYFRQKGYRIGFDHHDVWQQEHQAAFTVAKAMQIDLLAEIREQVDAALELGTTFETFKKDLTPKLQTRGWWGRKEMIDPETGERQLAQLGSPRRLEVIYDTNLATAYSEGQWECIQRNKQLFPFLEYVQSAAERPRAEHLAYAGLVLPVDHPFWAAHAPVKAWDCKCTVIQHSQRTLDREGLNVGQAPPEVMREVANKRTGEVMRVPRGVDPSFNYPLGGRRANLGRMMMNKADAAGGVAVAKVLAEGVPKWSPLVQSEFHEFAGRYALGERREIGARRVVGVLTPDVLDGLVSQGALPKKATVFVDGDKLNHLLGDNRSEKRKAKGAGLDFVSRLPSLLTRSREVWLDVPYNNANPGKRRLVILADADDAEGRAAKIVVDLDETKRGVVSNAVVSMDLIDAADFKRKGLVRLDKVALP